MNNSQISEKTDEELVALSIDNAENFGVLIDRYEPKLKRYIHRLTRVSDDDVKDILQEIFIKAYYHLHGFDHRLSFSSWIYRIAHNQVISRHRKLQARPHGHQVQIDQNLLEALVSDLDIDTDIDTKILHEQINMIFEKMDLKYREVLQLRYFEEKEYQEISDIIKKPKGTVSTLLNRAKKQFKKEAINVLPIV